MESVDGGDVEIDVFEHKEARSGKVCPIRLSDPLLHDLQTYAEHVANTTNVPYLFATNTGNFITPSAMSKLIHSEWARFLEQEQLPVTKMTASRNRKMAVTTIRDVGASREEQGLLARHMAHTLETADRYYDRSRQTEGRHAVLYTVQRKFREAMTDRAGGSRGPVSARERESNFVELAVARSRVDK